MKAINRQPPPVFGSSPFWWYAKNGARVAIKETRLVMKSKPQNLRRPIVTLFAPRSGSTWLMEMFARVDSLVISQDPLIERNGFPYTRLYDYSLKPIYFGDIHLAEVKDYLDQIFLLKHGPDIDFKSAGFKSATRTAVISSPNTPWAAAWFRGTYDARVLALLRHPLATTRSQMRFFRMPLLTEESLSHALVQNALPSRAYTALERAVCSQDEFHMRLAQIFVSYWPHIDDWPDQGDVFSYEDLLRFDFSSLSFLEQYDSDWEANILRKIGSPSRSTTASTEGNDHKGRAVAYSKNEITLFERLVEAFDAEPFMQRWGYLSF